MTDQLKPGGVFDRAISDACNGRPLGQDGERALRILQRFVLDVGSGKHPELSVVAERLSPTGQTL